MGIRRGKTNRAIGTEKEALALAYLNAQGLEPVARNYRCPLGEIDLILRDREVLVFVEVRFRRSDRFGGAAQSVGPKKRRRLIGTAEHYLQHRDHSLPCRFDVVALGPGAHIDWIRDAFRITD